MATIPRMQADESKDEMGRVLGEAGCLVVTNAFDAELRAEIEQAIRAIEKSIENPLPPAPPAP